MPDPTTTVSTLRARWEPVAATFPIYLQHEGLCARMYRAFSWLERVEELAATDGNRSADDQLIFSWTALNSLYGRWDAERREPAPEVKSLTRFIDQLFSVGGASTLANWLVQSRDQVMAVFNNAFLVHQFWNAPDLEKASNKTALRHKASSWYFEKSHRLLLEKLLLNVYHLRCQMIHGAATRNSSLNRDSLQQCLDVMRLLMPVVLGVVIEHGRDGDWGDVCYPVVR